MVACGFLGARPSPVNASFLFGQFGRSSRSFVSLSASVLIAVAAFGSVGCAAQTEEEAGTSDDALTAVPTGHFKVKRAPTGEGEHISKLTTSSGKKFELELVQRRTTYERPIWNPFITLPSTTEEKFILRGKYFTFDSDGETNISFDFTEGPFNHRTFAMTKTATGMKLKAIGDSEFELVASEPEEEATEARVLTCQGDEWKATITLDQAGRRRGTMKTTRARGADENTPPTSTFSIVFAGNTGVEDYQSFEGMDTKGNGYSFALKPSELEKTSGPISHVGVGFTKKYASYAWHLGLDCTIAAGR